MQPAAVLVIASRHRPHEQLLLVYSSLLAVIYLIRMPPTSVVTLMPQLVVDAWIAALGVGGVLGLLGCWWRGERGLGLELGGLLINTGALLVHAAAILVLASWAAVTSVGVILAWVVANAWRANQIRHDLLDIRRARRTVSAAERGDT